jgi:putative hemolysin
MEILIILLLITFNGAFAMSEMAIVSARKARLQQRAQSGDLRAAAALAMANSPTSVLSTVQIGITLVGQIAGVFGGATVATKLGQQLDHIPALAPYSGAISLGLVVLTISYLSLVLGELVPKRLALHSPERIAAAVAPPLKVLATLTYPAVRLLGLSSDLVLRILGVRPSTEPPITEEEIRLLLRQGTEAGVFEEAEHDMVAGVFRLGDRRAGTLMTSRSEIVWLDSAAPHEQVLQKIAGSRFSHFPVCSGSLDHVLGVVHTRDLLVRCLERKPLDVAAELERPLCVPEAIPAATLLEQFRQSGEHLALVVDEYGVLQGLVTLTDVLEEVVGEMEATEPAARQREDGSWLMDGLLPVEEFAELLDVLQLPVETSGHYQTLGGFIMTHLGRIPAPGDQLEWGGLRFEVVDLDGNRIDKVIVTRVPSP